MAVGARENAAVRAAVRVPVWAWVTGIVVLSTALYYVLGRRIVAPWILTDEFVYSESAKSFAATGHMLLRDHGGQNPGYVYPALISPAWALFSKIPDAYAAAKTINALLISLTAVPAYLLARRVLSQPYALVAAGLSVLVPSMLYAGTIMTENAFYPLFVGTAYVLVLVLERATLPRSILLIVLVAAAFATRAQGVFLLPAILTAPPLLLAFRRRPARDLVAYWPLYAVTAVAVVPLVLVQLARGHSVSDLFGRYSSVSGAKYPIGSVAKWFVYHVAELDLYLGIVPFAALILLVVLVRRLEPGRQAFAAAAVALSFWLLLVVAAVDQSYTFVHRVAERNMFYAAPFFLIGLLLWIQQGLPRPRWRTAAIALGAALLPVVLPFQWMLNISIVSDTLALIPWWRLDLQLSSTTWPRVILAVVCLAAGALFLLLPRRLRHVLPFAVALYLLALTAFATRQWHFLSASLRATAGPVPDWIDRTVPEGSRVAILYTAHVPPIPIWETEFFNRTAGDVYDLSDPMPGALPETHVTVARGGGLFDPQPIQAAYGLSDEVAPLAGERVASSGSLTLYRLPRTLAVGALVDGLHPASSWSGAHVRYRRFHCTGGGFRVTMSSDPTLFPREKRVTIRTGGHTLHLRVPPDRPVATGVPLTPSGGTCRAVFTVRPSPSLSLPPGSPPQPFGLLFAFS